MRDVGSKHQRIAISSGTRDILNADLSASTWAVLNNNRLLDGL
jgi:hypothetical protein